MGILPRFALVASIWWLSAPATAQVPPPTGGAPPGGALRLLSGSPYIQAIDVDGGGAVTDIANPFGAISAIDAGYVDPVTGDIVQALGSSSQGKIARATILLGSVVQQSTVVADIGQTIVAAGIELGPNGHSYYLNTQVICELDSTYQFVASEGAGNYFPGYFITIFNGATVDWPNERLWAGVYLDNLASPESGAVLEYDISQPIAPGAGTVILDLGLAGITGGLAHLAYGADSLYLAIVNNPTSSIWRYDLGTGALVTVAGSQGLKVDRLEYKRTDSTLHIMEQTLGPPSTPDRYHVLDPATGVLTTFVSPGSSQETGIALNDFLDLTSVVPERADAAVQTTFRFAAHGFKGDPAGVAITKVNGTTVGPLMLGAGICDWGGFYPAPPITLPAGTFSTGDTVTISSARWDVASSRIVWGADARVVFR